MDRDLRPFWIAVLARLDQLLGFAQSGGIYEHNNLLCGSGVKKSCVIGKRFQRATIKRFHLGGGFCQGAL